FSTIGAKSGKPSRIEIWAWWFEDRYLITGTPGPRHWMANIAKNPEVVVHVRDLDLPGRATVVDDREFRRRFFESRESAWYKSQAELDALVETAPMIEIAFESE
ncbi:MAG: nitroreductase family deazaflavin-dependent oxidoreductase, partial [Acidimicrobiia bacterium]|nr:nitroreductase family deazaflavin-dependent oxidoreductase [Acidimicrobiia bacterium]